MGNQKAEVMLALLLLSVVPLTLSTPQYERANCGNIMSVTYGTWRMIYTIENGVPVEGYQNPYPKGMADVDNCEESCKEIDECHAYLYTWDITKNERYCYLYESGD